MFARVTALAVVASLALPSRGSAQSAFGYEPGTTQYRVTQSAKVTQEMMGQKQDMQSTSLQLFTLAVTKPSKDTIAVTYTVDSIYATTPMGGPAPFLDRMKGMKVDLLLSPTGQLYSAKGPTDEQVPNASVMTTAFSGFLPKARPNLARGTTWSDTVSGKMNQFGIELDRKVISRNEVVKDTTIGGETAWILQRSDSTAMSGAGTGQGGPMTLEGSAIGKTRFYITPKGRLVGANGTEDSKIRVVLSANGMEIVMTTNAETKVEKAK